MSVSAILTAAGESSRMGRPKPLLPWPTDDGDVPLVAGESAVAGLAGLLALAADPAARAEVGLDAHSRVLLFGTEGDTDPESYRDIVGRTAAEVRAAAGAP